jgi:hypothetical protein
VTDDDTGRPTPAAPAVVQTRTEVGLERDEATGKHWVVLIVRTGPQMFALRIDPAQCQAFWESTGEALRQNVEAALAMNGSLHVPEWGGLVLPEGVRPPGRDAPA